MDNFQPAMLNDLTEGKSWVEKGVHLSQILERNKNTAAAQKKYGIMHIKIFLKKMLRRER